MKNLLTGIITLLAATLGLAQTEVTISGDLTDSTLIRKKAHLESKGFIVTIVPEEEFDEVSGDQEFIRKWTGSQLPDFKLTDMNGQEFDSDKLKGKYVHINFWSVTCRPCVEEFPELNELKKKYKNEVVFLAFAPESEAKVKKVLKKHSLDFLVFGATEDFFEKLGIEGYPKNFFIDPDGKIMKVTDGTNYTAEMVNGKMKMKPDNFKVYDEILSELLAQQ